MVINHHAHAEPPAPPPSLFNDPRAAARNARPAKPRARVALPDVADAAPRSGLNDWDYAKARDVAQQMIAAALADGTHDTNPRAFCKRCRQWCDGIYGELAVGGGGGVAGSMPCCKACWLEVKAPADDVVERQATIQTRAAVVRRVEFDLLDHPRAGLIPWAREHFTAAASAWANATDRRYEDRCLASIFRERADSDPAWLFAVVERWPGEVRRLAPLIVRAAGYRLTRDWLDSVCALAGTPCPVPREARAVA